MNLNLEYITLRQENSNDKSFLEALYRSTRDDLLQLGLPEAMMSGLIQMQFNAQQSGYRSQFPDAEYSIIEKEGKPIGYLVIHYGTEIIRLVYIALLPGERNRGYGRSLIHGLQTEAAESNKSLALTVDPLNKRAKHLYLDSGFQIISHDGANIEMCWS